MASSEKTNIKAESKKIGYPSDKKEEKKIERLDSQNVNHMEGIYKSNKSEKIKMKDAQKNKKDITLFLIKVQVRIYVGNLKKMNILR